MVKDLELEDENRTLRDGYVEVLKPREKRIMLRTLFVLAVIFTISTIVMYVAISYAAFSLANGVRAAQPLIDNVTRLGQDAREALPRIEDVIQNAGRDFRIMRDDFSLLVDYFYLVVKYCGGSLKHPHTVNATRTD